MKLYFYFLVHLCTVNSLVLQLLVHIPKHWLCCPGGLKFIWILMIFSWLCPQVCCCKTDHLMNQSRCNFCSACYLEHLQKRNKKVNLLNLFLFLFSVSKTSPSQRYLWQRQTTRPSAEILSSVNDHQYYFITCHHVAAKKTPNPCKQPAESSGWLLSFQLPASGMPAARLVLFEWGG